MKTDIDGTHALKFSKRPKVIIFYRPDSRAARELGSSLGEALKQKNYEVFTGPEQKKLDGVKTLPSLKNLTGTHLILALGGDGTYLRALRQTLDRPQPILGINMGSLGFLTPTSEDEAHGMVEAALGSLLRVEERALLEISVSQKGKRIFHGHALNDVVMERGNQSQLMNFESFLGDTLVSSVKADGIIIATPTGSTAYNLAAGGPLLHPRVDAIVLTAIAPHSLTHRPVILPNDGRGLRVQITNGRGTTARLVLDGRFVHSLKRHDQLLIQKSEHTHLMVQHPEKNFFRLLREKLKFGER